MEIKFSKYHGTGNDFIIIDNRSATFPASEKVISHLCNRRIGIGADGLILIEKAGIIDFAMRYFNSDGKEATMCGNGGRCAAAFAFKLFLKGTSTRFKAFDGIHNAVIHNGIINLTMSNPKDIRQHGEIILMDTGSPHAVVFSQNIDKLDVVTNGRSIRYNKDISENGVNVNFVEITNRNHIRVRTYERGVEDETLSCGTGAVASAVASILTSNPKKGNHKVHVQVQGGKLDIYFDLYDNQTVSNIVLSGPAIEVFTGNFSL